MTPADRRTERYKYGEAKQRYVLMLTKSMSEELNERANQMKITRSEVIERVLRAGGLDLIDEGQTLKKPLKRRSRQTEPPSAA